MALVLCFIFFPEGFCRWGDGEIVLRVALSAGARLNFYLRMCFVRGVFSPRTFCPPSLLFSGGLVRGCFVRERFCAWVEWELPFCLTPRDVRQNDVRQLLDRGMQSMNAFETLARIVSKTFRYSAFS